MMRTEIAEKLFKDGYNCSQAVVGAFGDMLPMDFDTLMKLSSSFGGGMGRLREVCGAVSGMFIVLGLLKGYSAPDDNEGKKAHYENIQKLAKEFEAENRSIVCRELLGLSVKKEEPVPEKRTEEYYKKRPCVEMVKSAVEILEKELGE
jgi:C_GCAxxG_C_C family probable redox protein